MTQKVPNFLQQGINCYVKNAQYVTDLMVGEPATFPLGSPAASSATAVTTAIAANSAANTDNTLSSVWVSDATFGRTLIYTPSADPGNANVVVVYGQDWCGQPMLETFTGASGSTAIVYGKKAFYRVIKTRVITPATNATTYGIGTGTKLGLPYKGRVIAAHENNLWVPIYNQDFPMSVMLAVADLVAGQSSFLIAPCPGYIKNVFGIGNGGGSTNNAAITVKLKTVAITGLTATPVQNASPPAVVTGVPTTAGYSANNRLLTGDTIELVTPAAASAKGQTNGVTITPTQFTLPDLTDPATTLTGDPRGLYEPLTAPAGNPITVEMLGDNAANSSGNGGFFGIQQYYSAAGT